MGHYKKLMLVPWFGAKPSWFEKWRSNVNSIRKYGYDVYMPTDFAAFVERVKQRLDIDITAFKDPRKLCDFRPAFAAIYAKEIVGYDFWGHTDLDVVFGQIDAFVSEAMLPRCDVVSNDLASICGPFSLFRNTPRVNELFKTQKDWRDILLDSRFRVFDEDTMSALVRQSDLRVAYMYSQPENPSDLSHIRFDGDRLYDGHKEIMMCHFNRTKEWPCH
jgi:hypothetical protein